MTKLKKKIPSPKPSREVEAGNCSHRQMANTYEEIQIDDERDVSLSSLEDLNNKDTKNRQRIL